MDNEQNVEKRSAENSDGRNLLMAYLGNVGGYDREYRSAEDENKPGISSDFNLMDWEFLSQRPDDDSTGQPLL